MHLHQEHGWLLPLVYSVTPSRLIQTVLEMRERMFTDSNIYTHFGATAKRRKEIHTLAKIRLLSPSGPGTSEELNLTGRHHYFPLLTQENKTGGLFFFFPEGLVVASLSALCAYKPTGVDCQTHMAKGVCATAQCSRWGRGRGALQWGLWAISKSLIKSSNSQWSYPQMCLHI